MTSAHDSRRTSMLALLVAAGVAASACGLPSAQAHQADTTPPTPSDVQCTLTWRTPPDSLIASSGTPVHIDQLVRPARLGASLLLLGSPAYVWGGPSDPPGPKPQGADSRLLGVVLAPNHSVTPVNKPPFMGRTSAVWALASPRGGAHIVWGVPTDSAPHPFAQVPTVRYAYFDGTRWSTPEVAHSGTVLNWRWRASVVTVGDDVVIAAPASEGRWDGIIAAARTRGKWATTRLDGVGMDPPNVVSMVASDSQAVLFYSGMFTPGNPSRGTAPTTATTTGLYVRRFVAGTGWSDPRTVREFPTGQFWPDLEATRSLDGTYHLFWTLTPRGGGGDVLYHTTSRDLVSWADPRTLAVAGQILDFTVAPEGTDAVRLVARTSLFKGIGTGRWTAGAAPASLEELSFGDPATPPTLTSLGPDSLILTWSMVLTRPEGNRTLGLGLATALTKAVRSCR